MLFVFSKCKMNWFGKLSTFFQTLYIAKVSHPTINVFQVEDFEDWVFAHLGIQSIDDTALFDDCISNIPTILKDGFRAESDSRCCRQVIVFSDESKSHVQIVV